MPATTPAAAAAHPPAIGSAWPGMGGVYAGVARGAPGKPDHHLIVAVGSRAMFRGLQYGPQSHDCPGAACEWDGLANTLALTADNVGHLAAEACAAVNIDGQSGFYLPARRELALCFANVPELFAIAHHWSSTQYSRTAAWVQYFSAGLQGGYDKGYATHVRAVRRLPLQAQSAAGGLVEGGAS